MVILFAKGGPLMWPILLCSLLGVTIALKKGVQFRKVLKAFSGDMETILKDRPGLLVPVLEAVSANRNEKEIGIIGTRQIREMEKGLGFLSLIAVISPLLGLTGTVMGMIKAFQVIAASQTQINPGMLAGGIWEALITTAAGLFVAIPAHVVCHFLEESLDRIALLLKETAEYALTRRNHEH